MTRKKSKYRPKLTIKNMFAGINLLRQSTPITAEEKARLSIPVHLAFGAFLDGTAVEQNFHDLARVVNTCTVISEQAGRDTMHITHAAIEAMGAAKGIGRWNELTEHWSAYKARVLGRSEAPPPATANIANLVQTAFKNHAKTKPKELA